MNECKNCKMPVGISCCFNCDRDGGKCGVWHNCGENCPGWEKRIKNDLISREALIKEIEHGKHPEFYDGQDIADWQMQCIENAPAMDAVEVVRRKDCKNHGKCTFEDTFITVGINDGYCRVGAKMDMEKEEE